MFTPAPGYHDAIAATADLNNDLDLEGTQPPDPDWCDYVRGQVELIAQALCQPHEGVDPENVKLHIYRAVVLAIAAEQGATMSADAVSRVVRCLQGEPVTFFCESCGRALHHDDNNVYFHLTARGDYDTDADADHVAYVEPVTYTRPGHTLAG